MRYFDQVRELLGKVDATQQEAITDASARIGKSLLDGGVWHVFGTGHSHMTSEELYYRAGGLAPVNAILFPALMQHEGPATSTQLERLPGLARIVLDKTGILPGEVLTIVSNSGKNAVPVEMAILARERGIQTVAITCLAQSKAAKYGEGLEQKLYEVCDVVIDNCGGPGDAALPIPKHEVMTGPTSSVVNLCIVQEIVYGVCCMFAEAGKEAPVFKTANLPGGDAWNARLLEKYGNRVNLS